MTDEQIRELIDYLAGPEGINLRDINGKTLLDCDSTLYHTRHWMRMKGIDGIAWLAKEQMGCDCQIVFSGLLDEWEDVTDVFL